jgi:hypothetical protein
MLKFFHRKRAGLGIDRLDPIIAMAGSAGNLEYFLSALQTSLIPAGNDPGVINVFPLEAALGRSGRSRNHQEDRDAVADRY